MELRKALLIDDEPKACLSLEAKLKAIDTSLDVRWATDPVASLEILQKWQPDVVFLDVQMPTLTGFEWLDQLSKPQRTFALVFCTAYSEFAIRAFEQSALDYLLKPVEPARLEETLEKVKKALSTGWVQKYESLCETQTLSRLVVKSKGKLIPVVIQDIQYFTSESHETILFTDKGSEFITDLSLNHLEKRLPPEQFNRCHRSYIVNKGYAEAFDSKTNELNLKGNHKIPVSKRNRSEFLAWLKKGAT